MSVRPVRELPPRGGGRSTESFVAKDVREFLRLGLEVACVEIEGRKPANVASALSLYIERHPDQCAGLAACCRQGRAYLHREGDGR